MVSPMPPIRSKPVRDADVWLDETLWGDEPAPRRRRAEQDDRVPARVDGSDLFDHERELDDRDEIVARRGDRRGPVDGPAPRGDADGPATAERSDDVAPAPAVDPADEPQGTPPGLLRRPLVEVQRSVPTARPRRSLASRPDRIALWAVALAVLTLVSAIITSHGG